MDSNPSHFTRARLLICTLPICAILSCPHIALFCQSVITSKQAPFSSAIAYSSVIHNPALSFQPTSSLLQFCLDLYTFIAAPWTVCPFFVRVSLPTSSRPNAGWMTFIPEWLSGSRGSTCSSSIPCGFGYLFGSSLEHTRVPRVPQPMVDGWTAARNCNESSGFAYSR